MVRFGKVPGENRGENPMSEPIEVLDDLFWLRDDTRKNEEVLQLLRHENAYTEAQTEHLGAFRSKLYDEMISHIEEDDDTHPAPSADGYEYWSRTVKGKSFRQFLRRRAGSTAEQLLLDVNAVASFDYFAANEGWSAAQCDVRQVKTSPSGTLLAYSVDGSGYETYTIRFKDLATGAELDEQIEGTGGQVAWASDGVLFYTSKDAAHRDHQVWRHTIGAGEEDVLVYEDTDELFVVGVSGSRDGSLILLSSQSKETSEISIISSEEPTAAPALLRARQAGVRYDVESHAPTRSLYFTWNGEGKVNRELAFASLDTPFEWHPVMAVADGSGSGGMQVLAHSATRSLDEVAVFRSFLAVVGREDGFTQLWVAPLLANGGVGAPHRLAFEAASFTAGLATNRLFDSGGKLRVEYTSMTSPRTLLEYDVAKRAYTTLKAQPVPGYDQSRYVTERREIQARDGAMVPVTLMWRPDRVADDARGASGGGSPCHLYGYGSYGICADPTFSATRLALVDRGVVFVLAHVRGGGECEAPLNASRLAGPC